MLPVTEVVAVAARSLDKAKAFVKETGIEGKAKAYGSYDELLDDANIQAVYIPLPGEGHTLSMHDLGVEGASESLVKLGKHQQSSVGKAFFGMLGLCL